MEFSILQMLLFTLFLINLVVLSFYDFKYKAVPDYLLLFALLSSFFITTLDIFEALQSAFIIAGAFVILNFLVTFYIQNIKSRFLKDKSFDFSGNKLDISLEILNRFENEFTNE